MSVIPAGGHDPAGLCLHTVSNIPTHHHMCVSFIMYSIYGTLYNPEPQITLHLVVQNPIIHFFMQSIESHFLWIIICISGGIHKSDKIGAFPLPSAWCHNYRSRKLNERQWFSIVQNYLRTVFFDLSLFYFILFIRM